MQRGGSPSSRGSRSTLLNPRGNSSTSRGRGRGAPSLSLSPKSQNNPVKGGNRKELEIHSLRNFRGKGAAGDTYDEFDRGFASGNSNQKPRRKQKSRREDIGNRDIDFQKVGTASTQDQGSAFDRERLENAAKREAEEKIRGGRGSTRGSPSIKSVRFSSPLIPQTPVHMAEPSPEPAVNPFSSTSVASPFGNLNTEASHSHNPLAAAVNPFITLQPTSNTPARNPFEQQKTQSDSVLQNTSKAGNKSNPFGSTSENTAPSVFGSSMGSTSFIASNPFGIPATSAASSTSIFGAPSRPAVSTTSQRPSSLGTSTTPVVSVSQRYNPFGTPSLAVSASPQSSSPFATPSAPSLPASSRSSNPFVTPSTTESAIGASTSSLKFGTEPFIPKVVKSSKPQDAVPKTESKTQSTKIQSPAPSNYNSPSTTISRTNVSKSKLALEIENLLRRQGIVAPVWPIRNLGDPKQKAAVETFWHTNKAYRAKVRTCLMRNGYLDDPDKPKKLSEAIDFKGTCEEMCPEFEIITRIMEHSVENAEKELSPDGHTWWPSLPKMIKALARSAAGQDAPLPDDVRSPAALRRTLDYLIDKVLGDNGLDPIHTFLWNRTRAVRRDFVFQQASMSSEELVDQVYCLELITRFHVVALHQMSREDSVAEDFSEQQEVEQLGKALLSLIHAYEDCNAQGIPCENESEFKAYYIVFNSQNPAILEVVQDWGYDIWKESRNIRTAVSLVETLQNIWDLTGPLAPNSATNLAQNAFNRFFLIIKDPKVSYTMACFAEIHFNQVRKAALKTILAAYRKQRDQTKDWTLTELNRYLHFDDEQDILTFGKAYGLDFDTVNGETSLAFDQEDFIQDPFPRMKQPHSRKIVERKRGDHTLPETIHRDVCEDPSVVPNDVLEDLSGNNSMFVPLSPAKPVAESLQPPVSTVKLQAMFPLATPQSPFPTLPTKTVDAAAINKPRETESQPAKSVFEATNLVEKSSFSFATPPRPESNSSSTIDRASQPPVASPGIFNLPRTSLFAPKVDAKIQSRDIVPSASSPPNITPSRQVLFTGASPQLTATPLVNAPSRSPWKPGVDANFQSPFKSLADVPSQLSSISATQTNDMLTKARTPGLFPSKQIEEVTPTKPLSVIATYSKPKPQLQPPTGPGKFPEWVMGALGENKCLIDEFIRYTVSNILDEVTVEFVAERKEIEKQEIRAEADEFRRRSLATKYGYLWRKNAHLVWLRRKGNRARILRRQMAEESFRKSQVLHRQSAAQDFKRSQKTKRENALLEIGVQNSVQKSKDGLTKLVHNSRKSKGETSPKTPSKTQSEADKPSAPSSHSHIRSPITPQEVQFLNGYPILLSSERRIHSSQTPRHMQPPKRSSPTSKYLKSLSIEKQSQIMRDCLTAPGGSMIFHMPNWSAEADDERDRTPRSSGVKTPHFRLQARGILTLPDGTPLASSAAAHHFRRKRSLDSTENNTTLDLEKDGLLETGASSKIFAGMLARAKEKPRPPVVLTEGEDAATIVARAREIMVKEKEEKLKAKQKRRLSDDDYEEAMALSKRIREQMDEGAEWYRSEIQKTLSRSTSQ